MLSIAYIARRFSTLCIFIINEFLKGIVAGTPLTKKGRGEGNETCPVHRYCVMYAYPMLVDLRIAEVASACEIIAFCFKADHFLTVSNMQALVHCHRST